MLKNLTYVVVLGIGLLIGFLTLLSPPSQADTFTVTKFTDTNDGVCDSDCSLREAIIAANNNGQPDTITLGAGIYRLTISGSDEDEGMTGDLDITEPLTITGLNSEVTIIDADGLNDRIFDLKGEAKTVVMADFTARLGNETGGDHGGGILSQEVDLTLSNTKINSNTTRGTDHFGSGGAVYFYSGTLRLLGGEFSGNAAPLGHAGGLFISSASLIQSGSTIIGHNGSDHAGGGLSLSDSEAIFEDVQIFGNSTLGGHGGGMVICCGSKATFNGGQIFNNSAINYGGGVALKIHAYDQRPSVFTQTDGTIAYNSAASQGGGIYVEEGSAILEGGQIKNNSADYGGGGVSVHKGTLILNGGQILSNSAQGGSGGFGGGIQLLGQNKSVFFKQIDGVIAHNKASNYGGGIYLNSGDGLISGGQIFSNTTTRNGGGIAVFDSKITISDGEIISNTVGLGGGGVYIYSAAFVTQTGQSLIAYNSANDGGGIYIGVDSIFLQAGGSIAQNSANQGGGIWSTSTSTLSGGQILNNQASNNGGGIYQNSGDVTINQSCIIGNSDTSLYHAGGSTLLATENWWGEIDGPSGVGLGSGDSVSNNIDFSNFRTVPFPMCLELAIIKQTTPTIAAVGEPITYTLTIMNGDIITVTNLIITDAIPAGATYVSGGTKVGDVIQWNLPSLPTNTNAEVQFVVTADQTLVNDDYRIEGTVYGDQSASAIGPPIVTTVLPNPIYTVDEHGVPISGTTIYRNSQPISSSGNETTLTDGQGLMTTTALSVGDYLVALSSPLHTKATVREAHELEGGGNVAYQIYKTSLLLDATGQPLPYQVPSVAQPHTLVIQPDNPLVLFNIVVSIEWDATEDYINTIEEAFEKASDYLYDVTDGQMAFGWVSIYDKAQYWADADFQFSTKNTVRPYAFVGGIISEDEAHAIRVGRFWNRQGGNSGVWNEPDGYRTLIHEFGHYALHLQDEYFVRKVDPNGNLTADQNVACTDPLIKKSTSGDATNASIMYWHYNTSELAGADRWNENCQATEQHRVNGKSDWETVLEHYGGPGWTLNTPSSRGSVMAGPDQFPTALLPFPQIDITNNGQASGQARRVVITDAEDQPISKALVALYTKTDEGTIAIDQGLSDLLGRIDVYGALADDTIKVATFNGALSGSVNVVEGQNSYQLKLSSTGARRLASATTLTTPYLNLIPSTDGKSLNLEVHGTSEEGNLTGLLIPGEGGGNPQSTPLAYSPTDSAFTGQVSFDGVGLGSGQVQVNGVTGGQVVQINSDYNLQQAQNSQPTSLYSEDGNFEFHLPVDGLPIIQAYGTVLPTGYVPGPLPDGLSVIGSTYEVRLSGLVNELEKDGVVRLHYHPEVMGVYSDTAIYFWDAANREWDLQGGDPSDTDNAWSVTARQLGIYALMGVDVTPPAGTVYLPMIVK